MAADVRMAARIADSGGSQVVALSGSDAVSSPVNEQVIAAERELIERGRLDVVRNWERRRRGLLRALHDRAQQQLLGLRMELLRADADNDVETAAGRVGEIILEIERLAQGLPPSALRIDDMASALREIAGQSGIPVDVDVPEVLPTSLVVAELLTYVAGEALANVLRHSAAERCTLAVHVVDHDLMMVVHDVGPALNAAPRAIEGHGIAELTARARLLGGSLVVDSSDAGTTVTLLAPNDLSGETPTARDFDDRIPSVTFETRDALRAALGDDAIIWYRIDGEWVDEGGQASKAEHHDAVHIVNEQGVMAVVLSARPPHRVMDACVALATLVVHGAERASSAVLFREVWSERNQVARRAAAMEESLKRRLTSRPVSILQQARSGLIETGDRAGAADLLMHATAAIREIVTVLSSDQTEVDHPRHDNDPFLFDVLGREFGVEVATSVQHLPAGSQREAIAAMGERIVVDASPGSHLSFRVAEGGGRATLLANMDTLPSPRAIAFIEDTVLWLSGLVTCELRRDRVRLQVVLPCASS